MAKRDDLDSDADFGDEKPIDFSKWIHLLLRYYWLILIFGFLAGIGAYAHAQRLPNIYASTAVLMVEQKTNKVLKMDEIQADPLGSMEFMNTTVESLKSPALLQMALETKAIDPEDLGNSLTVQLRGGTRLIDISVVGTDPESAHHYAKGLLDVFIKDAYDARTGTMRRAFDFLTEESAKLKAKLEASEAKLQAYQQEHQAVSLGDGQNIIADQLTSINTKALEAKSKRLQLESDMKVVEATDPKNLNAMLSVVSVVELPQVSSAMTALREAESEMTVLKQRYLEKHPKFNAGITKLKEAQRNLQEAVAQAGTALQQRKQSAIQNEASLEGALKEQENKSFELKKIAIPYNVLAREVDSDRAVFQSVILRLNETSVSKGIESIPFRIIEEPKINTVPVGPARMKIIMAAIFGGLILGAGLVVLMDLLDSTLRTVDQTESFLGVGVLAAVPEDNEKQVEGIPSMAAKPESLQAESFRSLRASLSLLGDESKRRTFLFTSAIPSEGKSYSSANCATAFAMQGLRTLLIDADLRRPRLHGQFNITLENAGLTDLLSGNCGLDEAIVQTKVDNLFIITAGRRAPNPAELLNQGGFHKVLESVLVSFDRVVVDSAPINAVSDTLSIVREVDAICMVVRAGKTPKRAIQRAAELVKKSGGRIAGVILNRLKRGRGSSYSYYYYGDDYHRESVYGGEAKK